MTLPSPMDTTRDLLARAAQHSRDRQDEQALALNRQALHLTMSEFQNSGNGEHLYLGLTAYRGIAVSALLTGRSQEAAAALETGLAHAALALKHWPDAPPFIEEQAQLAALKQKTGLDGAVHIPVENLGSWPFDD